MEIGTMTKRGIFILPLILSGGLACDSGDDDVATATAGGGDQDVLLDEQGEDLPEDPTIEERLLMCEADKPASCPGSDDSGLRRHEGLVEGAICQFKLVDQDIWESEGKIIDGLSEALEIVDARGLLGDLSRSGTTVAADHSELARLEGMKQAFGWDAFDHGDASWMPQGVSGSADAADSEAIDGRSVVAVSWYHKPEKTEKPGLNKGSRITFVDTTDLAEGDVAYEHVLLVNPTETDGQPDFRPIYLHVGGIAWVGDYLYITDTSKGLRVFDTTRMLKLDADEDRVGYDADSGTYGAFEHRYALPQVGAYFLSDDSCWHRFSFVSLDKTSDVPSLVTGEFHDADIAGKLMRWPLDGERLAATDPASGATQPYEVYYAQESDMQGAASIRGQWYMSSSGQDGAWGKLYRAAPGQAAESYGWVIGPEDLMVADGGATLWSASEFAGRRYVFSVDVSSY
jgi:hypothetical protein